LHHGRSRDGRLLYPAFPYTSYTRVTRPDADALFAYLRSLPAVTRTATPHALRWPYGTQAALAAWRALYFEPAGGTAGLAEGERGSYLVQALGHCSACHTARNALGASDRSLDLGGGAIPMQNWYAPALTSHLEAGVAHWSPAEIVTLLKTGVAPRGSVTGPMAEVVLHSTQYLSDTDLGAMAAYLRALPQQPAAAATVAGAGSARGAKLYEQHCADCHGAQGRGVAFAYPALAGNRAVTLINPSNLVQTVLYGGFAPATVGNPRPYGMAPYALRLNDADVAAVLTHIRSTWGNQAPTVSELDVSRMRAASTPH
jgi:mono/diheme cytochrome c family protein